MSYRQGIRIHGKLLRLFVAVGVYLAVLIFAPGQIAHADINGYSIEEIQLLAAAMELENGCNSDLCILLTGSVILNRVAHPRYPNTIYGVLHQKGQYAEWTLRHLDTVKVTERTMSLALKLIMCGSRDKEIIFQSMHPELGKVKYKVDTDYFATE